MADNTAWVTLIIERWKIRAARNGITRNDKTWGKPIAPYNLCRQAYTLSLKPLFDRR